MSCKRGRDSDEMDYHDNFEPDLDQYDNIINTRKLRKKNKEDIIGFCDCCERLTTVHQDKEQPQFNYCNDCEANDLAFLLEFLDVKEDKGPVFERCSEHSSKHSSKHSSEHRSK